MGARGLRASATTRALVARERLPLRTGPQVRPPVLAGARSRLGDVDRSPNSLTIEARSWLLTSRLVFRTETTRVTYSTYVRYDKRIAAIIWPPVSILHRQIVPRLLRHADRRAQAALSAS